MRALQRGEKKTRNHRSLVTLSPQSRIHPSPHDLHIECSKVHAKVATDSKLAWFNVITVVTEVGLQVLVGQETIRTPCCIYGRLSIDGQRGLACRWGWCMHI